MVETRALLGLDSHDVNGVSPSGKYIVTTRSRVDTLPVSLLIDRDSHEVQKLESAVLVGSSSDWQWPEPVKMTAVDGCTEIYGVVYKPPGFSSNQQYPVLDISSCCAVWSFMPNASFTNGPFLGIPYLNGLAYASLGFVVVDIEGRGTPFRNKVFQEYSYSNPVLANSLDDRVCGIRQLGEQRPLY